MGACSVSGTFIATNAMQGIRKVQQEAEYEHGYNEGYSGAENCVDFCEIRTPQGVKTSAQIRKFINERLKHLNKRDGEIFEVGIEGYVIYSTDYKENVFYYNPNIAKRYAVPKKPATLVQVTNNGDYGGVINSGTIVEMKQKAHEYLRKYNYECSCAIICRNAKKVIYCTYKGKQLKSTKRRTDDKNLVLAYKKYVYYGWAPE